MKYLILITGASGSGKSELASSLTKVLKTTESVALIHQDDYFTKPFLPYKNRCDDSYEDASGINIDSLVSAVENKMTSVSNDVVIVEGHMIAAAHIRLFAVGQQYGSGATIGVVLKCPFMTCKRRRLERRERTVEEYQELEEYIDTYVGKSFLGHGMVAIGAMKVFWEKEGLTFLELENGDNGNIEDCVERVVNVFNSMCEDQSGVV